MRKKILLIVAAIAALAGCMMCIDNLSFLGRAEHLAGKVSSVVGTAGECTERGKRRHCTRFNATIDYEYNKTIRQINVDAGQASGWHNPVSKALYQPGMSVDVIYDPRTQVAYRAGKADLWYKALICFGIALLMLFFYARIREPDSDGVRLE